MPHKIFVHSNARVAPANSTHSDFSYQLPAPIEVPHCRAFVDQVHIPNEFPTIHAATALPHCRSDVQLVLGFSVCMAVIRQRDTIIGDYYIFDGGTRTRFG